MTIIIPIHAVMTGLLAGALFSMSVLGVITGITAPLIPVFLLVLMGMIYGRAGIHTAALAALPSLFFTAPLPEALLIVATYIIPSVLMVRTLMMALLINKKPPVMIWSSLGSAILAASLYGAFYYGAMIATDNALYQQVIQQMQTQFNMADIELEPDMVHIARTMIDTYPHIILAMEYWVMMMGITAALFFAHFVADTLGMQRRPELQLKPFAPPLLLPFVIAIGSACSLLPYSTFAAAAQTATLIALLPYFFSGLASIHATLRGMEHTVILFIVFYCITVLFVNWTLIAITLYGLMRHITSLNRSYFR